MQDIKWIKLTEDNVPNLEVLCTNGKEFLVGWITKFGYNAFAATSDHEDLYEVTHFIDPKSIPYED